jgi:hypothetical protein
MASRCASRTSSSRHPWPLAAPVERTAHLPRRRSEVAPNSRGGKLARLLRWLGPGLCLALILLAGPARAAWMIPAPPNRAKDFTLIKRDGWYHCFYILRDVTVPYDSTEREFGHAVSRDLYLWTQLPPVLHVRVDNWDNAKVWAPDIHEIDGVYYMFYTGVTNQPGVYAFHQRVGLATSTDLFNWNRLDQPVLSCDQVRWAYCDPQSFLGGEFRDPFVIRDSTSGQWLMTFTARPRGATNTYVAGLASSSGDFTQWTNLDPLWISHIANSGTDVVESPHLFRHGGLYYLVFTGSGAQPLRVATGPDPYGSPATWTYHGTVSDMLSLDTGQWFASEYFVDGTHEYLAFVNYDRVDIREIVWTASWKFSLTQPALFHVQRLTWSASEVPVGQPVQLRIEAVNTLGRGARLEAVTLDSLGAETPISLAALGLPDSIPLPTPTVDLSWAARGPDPHGVGGMRLVVRMVDHTASAAPLTVVPDPWRPIAGLPPGDATPRLPRAFEEFRARSVPRDFRAVRGSPLGGTVLLIDLAAEMPARLEMFDLTGRRVRTLADRTFSAGASLLPWDGREESGAPARRGVYFARLTTPGAQRTVRLFYSP